MTEPLRLPLTAEYDNDDAKDVLRKVCREHRRSRTEAELHELGTRFTEHVLLAIGGAHSVAFYVSTGGEPPTHDALTQLAARGIDVLLPVLGPGLSRHWGLFKGHEDLSVRAPGRPPEPSGPTWTADALNKVDTVIIPALAVAGFGTRLGQGGGWYDRVLAEISAPTTVFAMVFDEELIATQRLPKEGYDQAVDAVITPARLFLIEGSPFQKETIANLARATS